MPFKRCLKCGKDFLAKTDAQELCGPTCPGPRDLDFADARVAEGRWWTFPLFFLAVCGLVAFGYVYSFDLQLACAQNLELGRDHFASRLAAAGPPALDHVLRGLRSEEVAVCLAFLKALGAAEPAIPTDHPAFRDILVEVKTIYEKEQDPELRRAAVAALGCLNDPEVSAILDGALGSLDLVTAACVALQKVGTPRAVPALIEIVLDPQKRYAQGDARFEAVRALGRIRDPEARAVAGLVQSLHDPSGPLRDETLSAFEQLAAQPDLTIAGKDRLRQGLEAMRRLCKGDTLDFVRKHGERAIEALNRAIVR